MMAHRIAVLVTVGVAASHDLTTSEATAAFGFCITTPATPAPRALSGAVTVHALWSALDAHDRAELLAALEESVSRREARLNPLTVDFEDGSPDDRLERLARRSPRVFGTARTLARRRFCGADGFCVRPTTRRCAEGEREPRGRELGRARFLAWPYGYARRAAASDARPPDAALVVEAPRPLDDEEAAVLRLYRRRAVLVALERDDDAAREEETLATADEGEADPRPGERLLVPGLAEVSAAVAGAR